MRAARAAALRALSTPTHATGTPGGICTIESSASSPSPTLIEERRGTPITGSVVCAATTGQRGSEAGAGDEHSQPSLAGRLRVLRDRVRLPVRREHLELKECRAPEVATAGCMRSRSDSEPMRMPTRSLSHRCRDDTAHRERDALHGRVSQLSRRGDVRPNARNAEDAAAASHERVVPSRRACVEDERAELSCLVQADDRRARVPLAG